MRHVEKSAFRCLMQLSLVIALQLFGGGCLISSDTKNSLLGNSVSESTFHQIKPGKTTEGWIRAALGPPTTEVKVNESDKVLKWTYTERRESSGTLFLVFDGHDEKVTAHTAYVEVANGIVTNAWRD